MALNQKHVIGVLPGYSWKMSWIEERVDAWRPMGTREQQWPLITE